MLLGRPRECARVDRLLEYARDGRSGTLLVCGEPGIGKSALLEYASARAAGMRVLHATGAEFESELAFSALHKLVHPLAPQVERLPAPQARALRVALALDDGEPVERFAVYAATFALLAAAAESSPLLVLADDCHWIDDASGEALAFVARRIEAEGIVILLATREDEPRVFSPPGLDVLRLEGIGEDAAAQLVGKGGAVTGEVASRLVSATGGNPLALLELSTHLTADQRVGLEPLADPLPVSRALEDAFLRTVRMLPADTQRGLLVAAAGTGGTAEVVLRAIRDSGDDVAALEPAETAGLIKLSGNSIDFRHPLVRSSVYSAAPPHERRAAHRALADALGHDRDGRRAWHLSAASLGPDEQAAAELERVAEDARRRGAIVSAARSYQQAAELSPASPRKAKRLIQASDEWLRAGDVSRAAGLLDEAVELTDEPELQAEIVQRQGYLGVQRGDAEAAYARTVRSAEAIESTDPYAAAIAFSSASTYPLVRLDAPALLELAERAERLWGVQHPNAARPKLSIRADRARILTGRTAAGVEGMLRCASLCEGLPSTGAGAECAESLVWVDQPSAARSLLQRELAGARENGDHLLVAFALNPLAQLELRSGRLLAAYATGLEAVAIAEEIGQPLQLAYNLGVLARVEAALGRENDCRSHVARAFELVNSDVYLDLQADARAALGHLALGLGRIEDAIRELERLRRILEDGRVIEPGYLLPWAADLIEAYAHARRVQDAERELRKLDSRARAAKRVSALALAARCHGLLAAEDEYEHCFEHALVLHDEMGSSVERFRTELCYAERLRRSKRRGLARDRLLRALETLDPREDTLWTARLHAELAATGARRRKRESTTAELTPQELQIALAVAEGSTNREVATRLFLSPKTIEFHLGNVYRKLGIRSRTELVRRLASTSDFRDPNGGGSAVPQARSARDLDRLIPL